MSRMLLPLPLAIMAMAAPVGAAQTGVESAASVGATTDTIAALQRQIDELKATVAQLKAAQEASVRPAAAPATATAAAPASAPVAPPAIATAPATAVAAAPPAAGAKSAGAKPAGNDVILASSAPAKSKAWYEKLSLRGYVQMRYNEVVSGDLTAPPGQSRLRSIHDSSIGENTNFSFRRVRLVLSGNITDWTSGVLIRQASDITDYVGSGGLLTFTAVTEAPTAGDTFIIV